MYALPRGYRKGGQADDRAALGRRPAPGIDAGHERRLDLRPRPGGDEPGHAGPQALPRGFEMTIERVIQVPADPSLADELAREELVEMANLTTAQTGIAGTIFISTAMGAHGPQVKYFLQPGRSQPSFSVTIADAPTVATNSLSVRVVRQMSPQVINWVSRNKDPLLDFWYHG